ncbi:MAG: HAMP domain-containing histidine kinase [Acidimicrobiaceae bacterium]|nr:HAMP domain-containing histidine kinase [Acidimicrobiaceae bacterium]
MSDSDASVNLRLRLTSAVAFLLVVIALLGIVLLDSIGTTELRQVDQQLQHSLSIVRTLNAPTNSPLHSSADKRKFIDTRFSGFFIAAITKGKRNVIVTPLGAGQSSPQIPPAISMPGQALQIFTVGSVSGSLQWRAVLVPEKNSATDLLIGVSLAPFNSSMGSLRLALFLAGLVILAVVIATGFWIAQLGLRPIAEVTDVADAITAGDRTRRVTRVRPRTEAGKLAQAFNLMLDEQFALQEHLRRFVADASHELRTPVSVIIGITELWRKGELSGNEERDEAIRRLGLSGKQIGKLVEDLLLLARLDEGQAINWTSVNLTELIDDVVSDALINVPERSIILHVSDFVVVNGDADGLRQIAANLISNALRHTPPNAVIEVTLSNSTDEALLEVYDSGPGMTPDEVSHAFDRFWQGNAGRSQSGAGLGLSIVRSIVLAHAGDVTLESDVASGTHVRVVIPRGGGAGPTTNALATGTVA